ncbi:MAG: EF-P lysine aminoacylase GenX, partial [Gammaproteobacteria bacterium]
MDTGEDWRPSATLATLRARAAFLGRIRAFFEARGVLEVETPLLSRAAVTDPLLQSVPAQPFADAQSWYLHTSPEFAMKRLLAAGSGPIFQLTRCFRRAESGPRHNPEFTMLEWYRPGFGLDELIAEVAELVLAIAPALPVHRDSYRELFRRHVGVDPLSAPLGELRARALPLTPDAGGWDRDTLLDLLFAGLAEPRLGCGCLQFVERFPASRASLARRAEDPDGQPVAARFELFIEGLELANGYDE